MALPTSRKVESSTPLKALLHNARADFISVGLFSCAINLLMLTGPLFMLQVYDRVLASGSLPTLVVLYLLIVFLFGLLGVFNFFRTRVLSRVGYRIENELMSNAQQFRIRSQSHAKLKSINPTMDISRFRQFVGGRGITAFFDLPWVPVFIGIVFLIHPWLGFLTIGGVAIITCFTIINEHLARSKTSESTIWEQKSNQFAEISRQSSDAIMSMGMMGNVVNYWGGLKRNGLSRAQKASNVSESLMSASKAIRLLLQSSILGLGCYLAVKQVITPGAMIAASIIGGRALSPIDQAIGNWRPFIMARDAYGRLNQVLVSPQDDKTQLSAPNGYLVVSNLSKVADSADKKLLLNGLNFSLEPGDGLGVIGPSASGKSSLAKLIIGVWMPERGSVRLDGATYDLWDSDKLGQYIGYLPQKISLLEGTIKQNISRFETEVSDEDVLKAANLAGVHELILGLPGGYDAVVGRDVFLSGGQVQRIGLARALYKKPPLIVLDEPNSNLDSEGDQALARAIAALRKSGSTVIVMAHRPSAIAAVNKLLMLRGGKQVEFGPKDEVLQKVTKSNQTPVKRKKPAAIGKLEN